MHRHDLGPEAAYATRLLGPPDLAALQALFERAADYFQVATGGPPGQDEGARAYVAGPPTKDVDEKRVIGIFRREDELVGVLDAIPDFPDGGTWTMGMLLLDPAHRGRGVGSAVLAAYEGWAREAGARSFRTAVVAHHQPGIRFLEAAGYRRISSVDNYHAGSRQATVLFFEKPPT